MSTIQYSERINHLRQLMSPALAYITQSEWSRRKGDPDINDFTLGNPHERPLPAFANVLQQWLEPRHKDWFAYKDNEPDSRQVVAQSLQQFLGLPFTADDIFMTNGAFAALSVVLTAVTDPGDEVIFVSPPWFFYEGLIAAAGGKPVRVRCDMTTFDLDIQAISDAITPRTRAIIINSPNNPTGKIYPRATLEQLADLLLAAGQRHGRPIYLLSDEAYNRIVFDGREFVSPTAVYPYTFLIYTYGKTLLTPGQRLGYIALAPDMPARAQWHEPLIYAQLATGYAFPNAILQYALADLEPLSIDITHLQYKRDWLVGELRQMGYDVNLPEATFYALLRSPIADDRAFNELLGRYDIYCLPGSVAEMPGYLRLSLTANEEMIARALPGFAAALTQTKQQQPANYPTKTALMAH